MRQIFAEVNNIKLGMLYFNYAVTGDALGLGYILINVNYRTDELR